MMIGMIHILTAFSIISPGAIDIRHFQGANMLTIAPAKCPCKVKVNSISREIFLTVSSNAMPLHKKLNNNLPSWIISSRLINKKTLRLTTNIPNLLARMAGRSSIIAGSGRSVRRVGYSGPIVPYKIEGDTPRQKVFRQLEQRLSMGKRVNAKSYRHLIGSSTTDRISILAALRYIDFMPPKSKSAREVLDHFSQQTLRKVRLHFVIRELEIGDRDLLEVNSISDEIFNLIDIPELTGEAWFRLSRLKFIAGSSDSATFVSLALEHNSGNPWETHLKKLATNGIGAWVRTRIDQNACEEVTEHFILLPGTAHEVVRQAMRCAIEVKQYKKALQWGQRLVSEPSKGSESVKDLLILAEAYLNNNDIGRCTRTLDYALTLKLDQQQKSTISFIKAHMNVFNGSLQGALKHLENISKEASVDIKAKSFILKSEIMRHKNKPLLSAENIIKAYNIASDKYVTPFEYLMSHLALKHCGIVENHITAQKHDHINNLEQVQIALGWCWFDQNKANKAIQLWQAIAAQEQQPWKDIALSSVSFINEVKK